MSLSVYQLAHSPYCLPITRALGALSVPHDVHNISNADRREIITLTNGAYYQVPVLVHDGRVIYESGADTIDVARYVDQQFADGRLFPVEHEGFQRLIIGHIEDDIEGTTFRLVDPSYLAEIEDLVDRTMTIRHKERKFGRGCVETWAAQRDDIARTARALLEPYELALQHRPFLFGQTPLYADFALFGVLGNLTYHGYNELPESFTALAQWFKRIREFRF
jgi:glutathione S-transferase